MKSTLQLDKEKKIFPILWTVIGALLMCTMWITRLNLVAIICVAYCMITAVLMFGGILFKKRLYLFIALGYALAMIGVLSFYIIFGADAGFGAFSSGLAGFSTTQHPWLTGQGNFFTRLLGNIILALPSVLLLLGIFLLIRYLKKDGLKKVLASITSLLLVGSTIIFLLTMNLRATPKAERLWDGEDDYLKNTNKNKTKENAPNILFIMTDDLGYGDISANGAIYDTPNIDSIGENGVSFENFYSSYSVCSPARFAALTGRYPYRGFADNVIFPTISTISPFAQTRLFNSIEMGANVDGMLGDEITIAETLKAAGYETGCFGKWHLGDYGEYLPTNQGFDYFYGSHHVNDMTPFYHSVEENGEYEIVKGTNELKDQSSATKWIHNNMTQWITNATQNSDNPFFAYYASPWPHAPIYVGEEFRGKSGMGDYVDCVLEFDHYLGELFKTLEDLGELDNTLIIFTSDNGPALEGSTDVLRGGKYTAYEGGQKVPFLMRWDNNKDLLKPGTSYAQSATFVDLFPTLIDLCQVTSTQAKNETYLPKDRSIDGVSMLPILKDNAVIHTKSSPILHMKREKIQGIQYTVPTADILSREEYAQYDYNVLKENNEITFKYFPRVHNDNSAFFDKYRKNWLHILTDDIGENYNRSSAYPSIAEEMNSLRDEITQDFKENRRGINKDYYQNK